jgi:hypothetical protein
MKPIVFMYTGISDLRFLVLVRNAFLFGKGEWNAHFLSPFHSYVR